MLQSQGPIKAKRRTGREAFRLGGRDRDVRLADFWAWAGSDLLSHATRVGLAEFIVANALGCDLLNGVRDEWSAWDLTLRDGTRVAVKSSGLIQRWSQSRPTSPIFGIPRTRAWNREVIRYSQDKSGAGEAGRHADVYIFALHAPEERETADPLDLDQWWFWVLATKKLNAAMGNKALLTFSKLQKLAGRQGLRFDELTEDLVRGKLAE